MSGQKGMQKELMKVIRGRVFIFERMSESASSLSSSLIMICKSN